MARFRLSNSLDPMAGLLALQHELERAFENPPVNFGLSGRGVFPPLNVFADKDDLVVRVEVPGVSPDSLKIETHGRTLTISGVRESTPSASASFHRRERDAGQFARSIQLPEGLDGSAAQASYQHGILTVRVPKKEEAKPRQITVQAA